MKGAAEDLRHEIRIAAGEFVSALTQLQPSEFALPRSLIRHGIDFTTFQVTADWPRRRVWIRWADRAGRSYEWRQPATVAAAAVDPSHALPNRVAGDEVVFSAASLGPGDGPSRVLTLTFRRGPEPRIAGCRFLLPRADVRRELVSDVDGPPLLEMAERWPWLFAGLTPRPDLEIHCGCQNKPIAKKLELSVPVVVSFSRIRLKARTFAVMTGRGLRDLDFLMGPCLRCKRIYWALHSERIPKRSR